MPPNRQLGFALGELILAVESKGGWLGTQQCCRSVDGLTLTCRVAQGTGAAIQPLCLALGVAVRMRPSSVMSSLMMSWGSLPPQW
jgi:hypothetical protein